MQKYTVLSMGEPAGASPEIITKTVRELDSDPSAGIIVAGDDGVFRRTAADLELPLPFTYYASDEDDLRKAEEEGESIIFLRTSSIDMSSFSYGSISAETGEASYMALKAAVDVIQNGLANSLVTTPLSGRALEMAGHGERSVFELLRVFASSSRLCNMISAGSMNIFGLTHRRSLRSAIEAVTRENIISALIQIDSLRVSSYFDSSLPIAVVSLNPASPGGEWTGSDERDAIIPAIEVVRKLGMNVEGPLAPEVAYERGVKGEFSSMLTMTAGEGFAASSAAAPDAAVLLTWGLPFLRVGVIGDAGLEIAGKGTAGTGKMTAAVKNALMLRDVSLMA